MKRVFAHSCEAMAELEDSSVALTGTSPPYGTRWTTTCTWLVRIFDEVRRVTKPGGFCAVVVGTVLLKSKHSPVPFDVVSRLVQAGWEFHQDIVWHKCTGGVQRAGVAIQKNTMTEYLLRLPKAGPADLSGSGRARKEGCPLSGPSRLHDGYRQQRLAYRAGSAGCRGSSLPIPRGDTASAHRDVLLPGELVLDPFAGSGQTLKVARALNRNYVGYETKERYVELCQRRVPEPLSLREKQLVAVFERVPFDEPVSGDSVACGAESPPRATKARLLDVGGAVLW